MLLSDIIALPERLPQNLPDTMRRVKKVIVDTIQPTDKSGVPDTIDSVAPAQEHASAVVNSLSMPDDASATVQLADAALPPSTRGMVFDDWSTTIVALLSVIIALSLCLYFVFKYRHSNRGSR